MILKLFYRIDMLHVELCSDLRKAIRLNIKSD